MIPSFTTVRSEFRVNSATAKTQEDAFVLATPDGGFQILWEGKDKSGLGVFGREFKSGGAAEGKDFRINSKTAGDQQDIAGAILPNGTGVYVWEGVSDGSSVTATKRFTKSGTLKKEIIAFDDGDADSDDPMVIGLANNDYAYFITNKFGTSSNSNFALGVQIDGATAGFGGLERSRSPNTLDAFGNFTSQPDAAPLKDGGLVWVWNEATDINGFNGFIRGEILTDFKGGDPVSFDIEASGRLGQTRAPAVEVLKNGNIAVTWMEFNGTSGADLDFDILMQVLDSDGVPVSALTRVHADSTLPQAFPDIVALNEGGFAISWTDFGNRDGGKAEDPAGIFIRAFDNKGAALGNQVQVNDTGKGNQEDSSIDVLKNGNVVVSWESDQGKSTDVFAKILDLSTFGGSKGQTMRGTNKADAIDAGGGKDKVLGRGGSDTLDGGSGSDKLFGANGNDSIGGGTGNDLVDGGKGNDTLDGSFGNDRMKGGAGNDSFVFYAGRDKVLDFQNNKDTLYLYDDLAGGLTVRKLGRLAEKTDDGLFFDFGDGNTLALDGISTFGALKDDLVLY